MRPSNMARPNSSPRRHGEAAKVILITLAVIAIVFFLACAGLGLAGYFWFKANFGQAIVSDPIEIRKLTAEIADITIPPEFTPYSGSKVMGFTNVMYRWCPQGNCPTLASAMENVAESEDFEDLPRYGMLTLNVLGHQPDGAPPADDMSDDDYLKTAYHSYEKETVEYTIKGAARKFTILRAVERDYGDSGVPTDDGSDEPVAETAPSEATTVETKTVDPAADAESTPPAAVAEGVPPTAATDVTATPAEPPSSTEEPTPEDLSTPSKPGRKVVTVTGSFRGKTGNVNLMLTLTPEEYDAEKVRRMLESIK
jgi:hypothetical protein